MSRRCTALEGEFFDAQCFANRADFFAKVTTCQLWYNVARKNRSRGWCSPLELLAQKAPRVSPAIFLLPPLPLEHLLTPKVGHGVPGHPAKSAGIIISTEEAGKGRVVLLLGLQPQLAAGGIDVGALLRAQRRFDTV